MRPIKKVPTTRQLRNAAWFKVNYSRDLGKCYCCETLIYYFNFYMIYDNPKLIHSIDNVYAVCKQCNFDRKPNQSVKEYKDQKDDELIEKALHITKQVTTEDLKYVQSTIDEPLQSQDAKVDLTKSPPTIDLTNKTSSSSQHVYDSDVYEVEEKDNTSDKSDDYLFNIEELNDIMENIDNEKHLELYTDKFNNEMWTYRVLLNNSNHYVMDIVKLEKIKPERKSKRK